MIHSSWMGHANEKKMLTHGALTYAHTRLLEVFSKLAQALFDAHARYLKAIRKLARDYDLMPTRVT